jgi:Molecular chaperone, HSP90 family
MSKKQFKTESKRLLDLMIHSIYTHKEVFLRELISNASDAIDKIYYKALTDENIAFNKDDYYIRITADKDSRTLTVADTGIGMTKEELDDNLGVIARSGSLQFKQENEKQEDFDIIGQFGVGFYSAFMVAESVTVVSRALGSDEAWVWQSSGIDGYTIAQGEKDGVGTEVILKLKADTEDEKYSGFIDEYELKSLIRKYSDFIRYPIKMEATKSRPKEGSKDEYESYTEEETVNSMVPIWRKNKQELKGEDYERFYAEKHYGFDKPLRYVHISAEGINGYNAILYIPQKTPYDFYTKEYEKGLELYSSGVLIMQKCADLLPDYFSFVQGLVDTEDLSLNISREMLQHNRQLKQIAQSIKSKIKRELLSLLKDEREQYETFFRAFGRQLKFGIYSSYGVEKEDLQDLLMFHSSTEKKMVTLGEYAARMKAEQKYIYYASGDSVERIDKLPQTEMVKDKGYEILYFTDDVDEFAVQMLRSYQDKEFKSVSGDDIGIENGEAPAAAEDDRALFGEMKELLAGKVSDVRASGRLKNYPVCLVSEGGVSIEMEKVLSAMPDNPNIKANKVIEVNTRHEIFGALKDAAKNDKDKLRRYTNLLYNQALLIEGLPVEDMQQFASDMCELMK